MAFFLHFLLTHITVTLISAAIIMTFTTMEFVDYRRIHRDTSMIVDRSRGEKLTIRLNMTYPHVPCYRTLCSLFPKPSKS